ncbi:MAG: LamG domain-containing protein [bacterium]|nr:LamG domain-containing protein [bacterium]
MSQLNELEYSALATQTGVSGITLNEQRVKFYDSQTGRNGSNPLRAEISYLQLKTSLTTSNVETLWRTYLINSGVGNNPSLNDMKRHFWANVGYGSLSSYIKSLSGLVAYYPLDETSGNAINQAPATLGTLNGTVSGATQGVAGQSGKAYSFDGVNDKIEIPFTRTDSEGTLLALIKPTSLQESVVVNILQQATNDQILRITLGIGGSLGILLKSSVDFYRATGGTYAANNWYLIALTNSASGNKLYINGSLQSLTYTSGSASANGWLDDISKTEYAIGVTNLASAADVSWFAGLTQHHAYFNTALSADTISQIKQQAGLA